MLNFNALHPLVKLNFFFRAPTGEFGTRNGTDEILFLTDVNEFSHSPLANLNFQRKKIPQVQWLRREPNTRPLCVHRTSTIRPSACIDDRRSDLQRASTIDDRTFTVHRRSTIRPSSVHRQIDFQTLVIRRVT